MFIGIWASRYQKVGPDEIMIVSGRKIEVIDPDGKKHTVGFRIVRGGGTFVWPIYENVQILSLKPVALTSDYKKVAAQDGASVEVHAKGQVRVKADDVS